MKLLDCVSLAGQQLARRRLRSFLCALSVAVGVTAMVLIAALGSCGQAAVRAGVTQMGLGGISIYFEQTAAGQRLTGEQAETMEQCIAEIKAAMPLKAKPGAYRSARASGTALFVGVTDRLGEVMGLTLTAGALPTRRQVENGERVAVIGADTAKEIYGRENVVGKSVRFTIGGMEEQYRIIGVIAPQAGALTAMLGGIVPSFIYVPYSCVAGQSESADQIMVQCVAGANRAQAGEAARQFLQVRAGVEGPLTVQDLGDTFGQAEDAVRAVTAVFISVAAIAFAVAMLGVLSGMLSATYEKTAEIGLFMALGARRRDITRIFLCQAILTCLFGGIGGLLLASLLLAAAGAALGVPLTAPIGFAALVVVLSALCGALAGLAPALRASRLHPVDAMRQ